MAAGVALIAILYIHFVLRPQLRNLHVHGVDEPREVRDDEQRLLLNSSVDDRPIYENVLESSSSSDDDGRQHRTRDSLSSALLPTPKQIGVLRVVAHEVVFGFSSSFCAYVYNPGLVPFLSTESGVLSHLVTAYMIGSTFGATITGWIKLPRLDINVFIMGWLLLFLFLFGVSKAGDFPLPDNWMIPVVVLLSCFNGYNTTHDYILAEQKAKRAGLDDEQCMTARRYTALANQFGVLSGSYFLVLLVHFDVFVEKAPMPK